MAIANLPFAAGCWAQISLHVTPSIIHATSQTRHRREKQSVPSVDFIMCTDRLKKDGFGTVMLDEFEDDAQILAHAARP